MPNFCRAIGCTVEVEQKMLMCQHHWHMAPAVMRADIWRAYRKRCAYSPSERPDLWADWLEACADAIEYIARKEHRSSEDNHYRINAIRLRNKAENPTERGNHVPTERSHSETL